MSSKEAFNVLVKRQSWDFLRPPTHPRSSHIQPCLAFRKINYEEGSLVKEPNKQQNCPVSDLKILPSKCLPWEICLLKKAVGSSENLKALPFVSIKSSFNRFLGSCLQFCSFSELDTGSKSLEPWDGRWMASVFDSQREKDGYFLPQVSLCISSAFTGYLFSGNFFLQCKDYIKLTVPQMEKNQFLFLCLFRQGRVCYLPLVEKVMNYNVHLLLELNPLVSIPFKQLMD